MDWRRRKRARKYIFSAPLALNIFFLSMIIAVLCMAFYIERTSGLFSGNSLAVALSFVAFIFSMITSIVVSHNIIYNKERQSFRDIQMYIDKINNSTTENEALELYEHLAIEIESETIDYEVLYSLHAKRIIGLSSTLDKYNEKWFVNLRILINKLRKDS